MDNQLASTHDPHCSSSGLVPNLSRMATLKKNSDPVWAKVAALESSIAAVEREQEIVEEAIQTKRPDCLSSQGFPSRVLRGLLVGKKEITATTTTTGGCQVYIRERKTKAGISHPGSPPVSPSLLKQTSFFLRQSVIYYL